MLEYFIGLIQGLLTAGLIIYFEKHYAEPKEDRTFGAARSPQWPKVRAEHLKKFPNCALCGGNKVIEVHHIQPFHLKLELELEFSNLITLCEEGKNGVTCHLHYGHLGNYRSFNKDVITDTNE